MLIRSLSRSEVKKHIIYKILQPVHITEVDTSKNWFPKFTMETSSLQVTCSKAPIAVLSFQLRHDFLAGEEMQP